MYQHCEANHGCPAPAEVGVITVWHGPPIGELVTEVLNMCPGDAAQALRFIGRGEQDAYGTTVIGPVC